MAELKPCKCKNPLVYVDEEVYFSDDIRYRVVCDNCGKSTEWYKNSEQAAIDAWNRRAEDK